MTSKAAMRPPDVNDLIADLEPFAIPVDLRISSDIALPSPDPPALFRSGKVASPLQRADLDAARLLDCAPVQFPSTWSKSKSFGSFGVAARRQI
jgi:hypothetical protein